MSGAAAADPSWAGVRLAVITCSTRAAQGVYPDRGGELIASTARSWGAEVTGPDVVADGPEVAQALRRALDSGANLVLTTGGTGLTPTDGTPEATRPFLDREVPGIAEALRVYGVANGVPTAALSRGLAGTVGGVLVVNLPGSTGGVRDAMAVLGPVVPHAIPQLMGGDH